MTAAPTAGQSAQGLFARAREAHDGERLPEAEQLYRAALAERADFAEALLGLGALLHQAGRLHEARECLVKFTELVPGLAYAWEVLGQVLAGLGDRESAIQAFSTAAELEPAFVAAHVNLGLMFAALGRAQAALHALRAALVIAPDDAEILKHYAIVALDAGKPDETLQAAERAEAAGLDPVQAARLLGLAHLCAQRFGRAEPEFRRALQAAPDSPELVVSLGVTLEGTGRDAEAIAHYRAYLAQHHQDSHVRFMLALLLLGRGAFGEGWQHYMARPAAREQRASLAPVLDARELPGQRVLVHAEQGLGDEILFLRYVQELRRVSRPEAIAYAASPKLQGVLARVPELDEVRPLDAPPWPGPRVLLGDLPFLCRGAGPAGALPPPLRIPALPDRLAKWRGALAASGPAPYVAVNWQGGRLQARPGQAQWFGRLQVKRIGPELLGEALRGWPGTVVCLQWMQEAADLEAFRKAFGGNVFDAARAHDDIEDLLALLESVDELVGVSSVNAHLRAAACRPGRVLVQQPAEWRWMQSGEHSPWYPEFTVYRQRPDLDWSDALAQLRRDLGL
ncbi:MAG: hypothetical protein A3I02_00905 [Betaproteobacteria bacterium RIFCSPLOWO2_02_FULL_67_26]|nr:MAG: hypothetical protein A3I02_00905 [Betaproteobacteria bacterium RIFCSPLOWO2_02_FULL_67_26]